MTKKIRENFYILMLSNLCTAILVFLVSILFQEFYSGDSIKTLFSLSSTTYIILCVTAVCIAFVLFNSFGRKIVINNNVNSIQSSHPTVNSKAQEIRDLYVKKQNDLLEAKYKAIFDYTCDALSPFLSIDNLELLCQSIRLHDVPKSVLAPVCTDGRLSSVDLRHYGWNVGERLGWDGQQRAVFLKLCFPNELANFEIETLRCTLRYDAKCQIKLDIPEGSDYSFKCNKQK